MEIVIVGVGAFFAAFVICFIYFYGKEKKLLERLYDIIEQAEEGTLIQAEISEEKLSLIEERFRKFMRDSLLARETDRQQKQVIQSLISDISHQTLTPISNLKLYAELLKESATIEQSGLTDTLCEQSEKLDFLIQSLVRLSRMETGLIGVHPQDREIQSLFDVVCKEYGKKATEKDIKLSFAESSLRALFDLKWTSEALGNIVDNAIKYTQSGGKVDVCAKAYTFFVRIDVTDNGIGIAKEEFTKIFARFYRSVSSDDRPGVGIGLYLAREIVQSQKGYIMVSSQERKGTVFSVYLPCA